MINGKLPLSLFLLRLFLLSPICISLGQVQDGTPCYTSRQEYGTCINIKQCKVLIDILRTQNSDPKVREYLRTSTCGYAGTTPMVCCPQATAKSGSTLEGAGSAGDDMNEGDSSERSRDLKEVTLLEAPECGFSNVSNPRIVGGTPAALGEFPWLVALGYRNSKNPNNPKWSCGGSLISERHILTAAHCVHNRNDLYIARVGEHDLYDNNDGATPEDIPLIKAKVHDDYSSVKFTNDIAILTLERKPTKGKVWPICLPHNEPYRSNTFIKYRPIVAGWGSLYFNGPSSSVLQATIVPVVDNSKCERVFTNKSVIDSRILCAGWTSGGKDACKGDSGGPLMYAEPDGENLRYYQIGIVSYGFRCAEAGYPGVYTRVTNFIDFIRRNLN